MAGKQIYSQFSDGCCVMTRFMLRITGCHTRIGAFALAAQGAGDADSNSIHMPASQAEQATGFGSAPAAQMRNSYHSGPTSSNVTAHEQAWQAPAG